MREEDQYTRVTLLEYLKQLHPVEWENFVEDTMILAEESAMFNGVNPFANDEKGGSKTYDLPFYFIGFTSAAPEFTFVLSSDSFQDLFWHDELLKGHQTSLPCRESRRRAAGNTDRLERELERIARRKFKFVVSMQRYSTRKNTRMPSFCCAHTPTSNLRTSRKSRRGRKEAIPAFSLH